jgi:hypothetical protein
VIFGWNPAPGDTLAPEERSEVPLGIFLVDIDLQIDLEIPNAAFVVGRGAGGRLGRDFAIRVGNPEDLFRSEEAPSPPSPADFFVTGAFQFGENFIGIGFSDRVDAVDARDPVNYSLNPPLTVQGVSVQENGQTVILETMSPLPASTSFTVNVSGIDSEEGDPLTNPGAFAFQTVAGPVRDIAEVHGDLDVLRDQVVTVVGQVYIPVGSRGGTPSGYIQDGSGRGINLYGGPLRGVVNQRGNVAEVTGTVIDSLGVVSVASYTASLLSAGQPRLAARALTLEGTQDPLWEGTFIEATGRLARIDEESDPEVPLIEITRLDTLFAGYRIWRSPSVGEPNFSLLRNYSLLDSTWTFTEGAARIFSDPDSIIRGGEIRDREFDPDEKLPGPFNGFGYLYSVTTFDAVVDGTVFPYRITEFENNLPADVARGQPIFPGPEARVSVPLLAQVKVVPNPYNPAGNYGQQVFPGDPRVRFVNLPSEATIRIFTVAGDLVRVLEKDENSAVDALDWDLTNKDQEPVAAGIYIFLAEAGNETKMGRFVIAR